MTFSSVDVELDDFSFIGMYCNLFVLLLRYDRGWFGSLRFSFYVTQGEFVPSPKLLLVREV